MAKLASIASGNFTSSSTWGVINEQSFQSGVNSVVNYPVTTTATSLGTFSPASTVTATHIGFRLVGTGNIGTLSFDIFNVTAGAQVSGTSVTINKSALNFNTGSLSSSWYLVKIPTPPSLSSGTNYAIRVSHSVGASTTSIMSNTNSNASTTHRFIVTSTTQAPASTDDLWIVSEWVTGSTVNEYTVTMDNTTSATTFGSASANFGGVNLNTNAYLNYGTSSSTNYYLRINGNIWQSAGASLNIGTSATTIPSSSTAVLEFTGASQGFQQNGSAVAVSFGTYISSVVVRGDNPTNPYALLNADAAVSATSITTNIQTGWKSGDTIVIAGTGAVATGQDLRTLSTDAVGTTLTVTSGLTNAHGGSGDVIAEVINLTRNVKIRNSNASQGVMTLGNVLMDIQGCEIRNMGSMTISGAGLKTFRYNSFYNSTQISAIVSGVMNFDYNCFYNCSYFINGNTVTGAGSTASPSTVNFNYFILSTLTQSGYAAAVSINPKFTDFIGNIASGFPGISGTIFGSLIFATSLSSYTDRLNSGIISANTLHSSTTGVGIYLTTSLNIYDLNVYRISASRAGVEITSAEGVKIYNSNFYGNISTTGQINIGTSYGSELINCNFRGGTTITASRGLRLAGQTDLILRNCTFGTGQTHSTADVEIVVARDNTVLFENCLLNSTTKFSSLTNLFGNSFIKLQRYQQTNNNHYIYTAIGNAAQYDGVIFRTGTASTRLIPLTTTFKHKSPLKIMPVASGQTPTVSVWVRKSSVSDASGANYNGAQPRLMLGYSPSVFNYTGQTDQVLATMTAGLGTWEQLTATIPYTAYSTGGFNIYVDCDGTTGWINVDDWSLA
jgi:hypothetical protein